MILLLMLLLLLCFVLFVDRHGCDAHEEMCYLIEDEVREIILEL